MASHTSSSSQLTVPARYLEDIRTALIREIHLDAEALSTADAAERESSARILHRDEQLLAPLLAATDDVELTAAQDQSSSPLVDVLETFVRVQAEHLAQVANFGPVPMGDVLDLSEKLRWAAWEAIRIEPLVDSRLTAAEREA